jgi:hypothetical protein
MTLSRGCRSDKAKFAHNHRLDFAVREALLLANPASHVKLKGSRASNNTITTVPFWQGYGCRFYSLSLRKERNRSSFLPGKSSISCMGIEKTSIQEIIPKMDVISLTNFNERNLLKQLPIEWHFRDNSDLYLRQQ